MQLPCRLLDTVAVKGKTKGVKIYTARRRLEPKEREAWGQHNMGMAEYYERNFANAARYFKDVLKLIPDEEWLKCSWSAADCTEKTRPPRRGTVSRS